jgi:hypothetical protein
MNKFGICFQRRNEHLKSSMFLFSVGNGAMTAPRYWQRRKPASVRKGAESLKGFHKWGTDRFF